MSWFSRDTRTQSLDIAQKLSVISGSTLVADLKRELDAKRIEVDHVEDGVRAEIAANERAIKDRPRLPLVSALLWRGNRDA